MITQKRLKEVISYDPESGVFTWVSSSCHRVPNGSIAGCGGRDGYIDIKVDKKIYRAHRLAWLYMTGCWPKDCLDHKNGNRKDNRFDNLREATRSENSYNKKISARNRSGVKGVHWVKLEKVWRAKITAGRKARVIGNFKDLEDAKKAILEARAQIHGEFANDGWAS